MNTTSEKEEKTLYIVVDNVGYEVKVASVKVNDEKRFVIRVNDADDHMYVWDEQIQALRALDDEVSTIPATLEKAISDRLMQTVILH